jgi:hypothetical protein
MEKEKIINGIEIRDGPSPTATSKFSENPISDLEGEKKSK